MPVISALAPEEDFQEEGIHCFHQQGSGKPRHAATLFFISDRIDSACSFRDFRNSPDTLRLSAEKSAAHFPEFPDFPAEDIFCHIKMLGQAGQTEKARRAAVDHLFCQ